MYDYLHKWLQQFQIKIDAMDRKYRAPRQWSNRELRKFAPLFTGSLINVSAADDSDKEGNTYQTYFPHISEYFISNYQGYRGYSKRQNEFFLDLSAELPQELRQRFDVVFNHTTLEHIFDFQRAFENLCSISRDIVILVVPFIQESHGAPDSSYLDYWRFTPQAIRMLFEKHGFGTVYESATTFPRQSVYIFTIASRDTGKWQNRIPYQQLPPRLVGDQALPNTFLYRLLHIIVNKLS